MEQWIPYLPNWLLLFCRITAFMLAAPVFSTRGLPPTWKIGVAAMIAFITFPAAGLNNPTAIDGLFIVSIIREVLVGLLLGFTAYMFFTAVQIAGSFIDIQMGLGIANVIDPMTGAQSPLIGNFKFILAMLLFLTFNGHHYMIEGLIKSYEWMPLSNGLFAAIQNGTVHEFLLRSFASVFSLALQMSTPLVVALFLTDIGLGILSKTAPQFNIFVVGVPIKILIGFLLLVLVLPGFVFLFQDLFSSLFQSLDQLVKLIGQASK
ncbi:flagellar biosynthetic protein FliR [Paenibacillus ginsengarvi]|uniref:Flagellar biosynthetic protein FliR n=1 Tax=Paenibacillus ginsengarvi TaxID=400777 RepID=A0A3B0CQ73_9BACL|nr:flagellar biosynthetic protein FliR [Paenibacillus ginsengarvi]RKN86508.1 flagellar type III secretion system protein FliR [Paenibacillus ginsengarvi]